MVDHVLFDGRSRLDRDREHGGGAGGLQADPDLASFIRLAVDLEAGLHHRQEFPH